MSVSELSMLNTAPTEEGTLTMVNGIQLKCKDTVVHTTHELYYF